MICADLRTGGHFPAQRAPLTTDDLSNDLVVLRHLRRMFRQGLIIRALSIRRWN